MKKTSTHSVVFWKKKALLSVFLILAGYVHFGQTTYSFTCAGLIGPYGPSQAQINSAYANTNLNGLVTVSGNGIQNFTVPTSGLYTITAIGAQGGYNGGYGARISGEFNLAAGTVLKILVGQQGAQGTNSSQYRAGGGGGGSYVASLANVPYVVAGGGGGNGDGYSGIPVVCCLNGMQASTVTSGNPYPGGNNGGTSANGGSCISTFVAGGGAGFNGDGSLCNALTAALSFTAGGTGGLGYANSGTSGNGGFGGGGGHYDSGTGMRGGGGGGYSGGGGGRAVSGNDAAGGGGGSFNAGSNQINTLNTTGGNGMVVIQFGGGIIGPPLGSLVTNTFSYTGASQTFTVPSCVTSLTFDVRGAKGGASNPSTSVGGNGGLLTGVLSVTPGQVLQINVGGSGGNGSSASGGAGGFNGGASGGIFSSTYAGGGGGGASDVRVSPFGLTDRIIVAGGGGGGGFNSPGTNSERGGAGGGMIGEAGYYNSVSGGTVSGGGGSSSSGGMGGNYGGFAIGNPGALGFGGSADLANPNNGGGGGGGYYGGGGGAFSGGGGGSSFAGSLVSNAVHTQGYQSAAGVISFSYLASSNSVANVTVAPSLYCAGTSVTLSSSGMTSYTWSSASGSISNSASLSVVASNTNYTLSTTNASGCTSSYMLPLSPMASPTVTLLGGPSKTVCEGYGYSFTPQGAVSYSYSGGSSTVFPPVTTVYSITGTGANGCVSAPTTVTVNVLPAPTINVVGGSICSGKVFTLNPSGATSYSVNGTPMVGTSMTVSPSNITSYIVYGTGTNGCMNLVAGVATVTVFSNPTVSVNSGNICSGAVFTLNPSGAVTYTFSSGSSTVAPTTNTTYTVTGTNSLGCVSASPAVSSVSVLPLPVISVNGGTVCPYSSFTLNPSGALNYTYSSGSNVVAPATTTSYSVTGTGTNGCLSQPAVATVVTLVPPTINVNSGAICAGNIFTITPSGAVTYTLNGSQTGASFTVSPSISTTYTVTSAATGTNGCLGMNTTTITVYPLPTVSINSGGVCNGGTFTLTPNGAATYTYLNGGPLVTPTATGSYSVIGASTQGCVSSNTAVSAVALYPIPTISVSGAQICQGKSYTIVPSGASTYTITGGSSVVTPTITTSYSVVGTSSQGCVSSNTAVSSVTVNPNPTITVNSGTLCSGNQFTLVPGGAQTYTFSSGSPVVSPNVNTTYYVTGTNIFGCASTNTAVGTVTVYTTPTITINSGGICSGNGFTITPNGAATYTYLNGGPLVTPTATGSYSVIGTSAQGCVSSNTAVSAVTLYPLPTISVSSAQICLGQTFTIVPSGASTYTITGGSSVVTPTITTSYSVVGTSSQGCVSSNTAVSSVTVNPNPTITVNSGTLCSGNQFTLMPSGAQTYTFSSGSPVVSPNVNTTYYVTGTNIFGCASTNTAAAIVTVYTTPTISINSGTVCSGRVFTLVPTGATTYSYLNGGPTVTPTSSGTYSVLGMSSQGCISSNTAVANLTVYITPTIAVNSGQICQGQTFTLNPSGANAYTLSGGSTTVNPVTTTNYSVTGTSAQGCVSSNTAIANVIVNPNPTVTVNSGTLCSGNSFTLIPSGAFTYSYSGGTAVVSPSANALYYVTGVSALGCASSNTAISSVTVFASPIVNVISSLVQSRICSGESNTLIASGANSYAWSNGGTGNSIVISPSSTTNYTVTGTNTISGCAAMASITQSVDACLGVISPESEGRITVFPNPTNGRFTIDLANVNSKDFVVQIVSPVGELVANYLTTDKRIDVSLNEVANGVYFIRVISGDKVLSVQRIIKQ